MYPRRWWLLAGAVPVALACAVAVGDPALRPLGDAALVVAGLIAAAVLWVAGGRCRAARTGWRLLAVAPLFPVAGAALAAIVDPPDPLHLVVLRWAPTLPAYGIGAVAILSLVDRARLRAGPRVGVEVALFFTAGLAVVNLLVTGPAGGWAVLGPGERTILGAAVLVTSAMMTAALTLFGAIEPHRRRMAVVLLVSTALLTAGRGLGTSATLTTALGALDVSRFLVVAGLFLLALSVLIEPGPDATPDAPARTRSVDVGQLLPHAALFVAGVAAGAVGLAGHRTSTGTNVCLVVCVALTAVHRWMTAREEQRLGARLRRREAYFRSLVRSGGDAVVILDDRLTITWASPALGRSLGTAADDLLGRPLPEVAHPEDVPTLLAALTPAEDGDPLPAGLLLLRLQDEQGVWRYLEAGVSDLRADADVGAVVLHCRDMTDRHTREQALQSVAYTDPMTGLPNTAGLLKALQQAMSRQALSGSGRTGEDAGTLLMIELDGLVAARQHAGRETAATVIAEVGRRLRDTVRGEDVVARMGGGAFAVLTEGRDCEADRLADRCLAVVEQPIATPAGVVDLTANVGLVALEEGLTVEELLHRADLAVRAASEAAPGSAARYGPAIGEAVARRDRLREDLRGASARGELFLLFQPIVSLTEQRITGAEARLHWRHPALGEVPAAEFVPVAERAGLIGDLMRWALVEVATAAVGLPEAGPPVRVGLLLPAGYVATGTVVADVAHALDVSGLPAERLVLQIDAGTVMSDDDRTRLDMSTLRLMGVHVALEGFGSDASALAHLTRLPIDIVRLDRSLISRIDRDPQQRALCASVIGIVRALGPDVVADGVETPAQLAALCGVGCGFAQGFLLARPGPLAALAATLTDGETSVWPGLIGSR